MSNPNQPGMPGQPSAFGSTSFADHAVPFETGDQHGYAGTNDPLPAGWYKAWITASEFKPTKDNTGVRLNLTWEITDGPNHGRKVFTGLNLRNASAKAEEISRKELNTIYAACLFPKGYQASDSTELHSRQIWIKLKVQPGDAQYGPKNEINGYHPDGPADPATGGPQMEQAPGSGAPPAPSRPVQTAPPAGRPPAPPVNRQPAPPVAAGAPTGGKLPWQS